MNIIDLVIIGFILLFMYKSYRKGFTKDVFSLVALFSALFLAFKFYYYISSHLNKIIKSEDISNIISIIIIFIIVNYIVNRIGDLFNNVINKLRLNWVNGFLGACIGLLKGFLLVGVVLMFLAHIGFSISKKHVKSSKVKPFVELYFGKIFKIAKTKIPDNIKVRTSGYFNKLSSTKK
ncbi:MAG: CvpA family protein [Spirochaetota bacterium]|nr:CvpA family protein [Spirochaetota bacterium]